MSQTRSSSTRSSGGSSGGSRGSMGSMAGDDAGQELDTNLFRQNLARRGSVGSMHLLSPSSPGLGGMPRTSYFVSPMIPHEKASSTHSDSDDSGRSSAHSSPTQPPLPPPGFQPPIAFNPAAQIFVRQSSGSSNGSSRDKTSSGENGSRSKGKSKSKSRGKSLEEQRRSSEPSIHEYESGGFGSGGSDPLRPALLRNRSESHSSGASSTSVSPPSTIPASPSTSTPMRYPTSYDDNGTNQTRDVVSGVGVSSGSSSTPVNLQSDEDVSTPGSGGSASTPGSGGAESGNSGETRFSSGTGESGSGETSGSSGNNQSRNGRSQTSIDLISTSVFSANGFSTPLNPPLPPRTNSEAWDSVWPATSPYAVPHLPAVHSNASSYSGSSQSGSSKSGTADNASKASSGSSPSLGQPANLGSPIGVSLLMSPSAQYPPALHKRARGTGSHRRTPSASTPGPHTQPAASSSTPAGKGSPFLGAAAHQPSSFSAEFDSPLNKARMELKLPSSPGGRTLKTSPHSLAVPRSLSSPTPSPPGTPTAEAPGHAVASSDLLGPADQGTPLGRPPTPPPLRLPSDSSPILVVRTTPLPRAAGRSSNLPSSSSPRLAGSPTLSTQAPPLKSPRPTSIGLPLPGFSGQAARDGLTPPLPSSPGARQSLFLSPGAERPWSGERETTPRQGARPLDEPAPQVFVSPPAVVIDELAMPSVTPVVAPAVPEAAPASPTSPTLRPSPPAETPATPAEQDEDVSPTMALPSPQVNSDVDNPFFPPTAQAPAAAAPGKAHSPTEDLLSPPVDGMPPTDDYSDEQEYVGATEDMDIDDEGLTTLERIFLLSKSEFTHHRIFISRVIGEWMEDVDPCETVEYVLPLLNSLGTDEDEAVREALAPSLHKILWFFYSTCRLFTEDEDPLEVAAHEEGRSTVTITEDGIEVVPRPTLDEVRDAPPMGGVPEDLQRPSPVHASSSDGSADSLASTPLSATTTTPNSTAPSESTSSTQISETDQQCYLETNYDEDDVKAYMQPVRKPRPVLSVQTFTPLVGSLLMSHSSLVCESAKAAIIGILARLRNIQLPTYEPWPERHVEVGQSKTYYGQTGVHIHENIALKPEEKKLIQDELLNAIVIGMARLDETVSPFNPEQDGDRYVEGDGSAYGGYFAGADTDTDDANTVMGQREDAFGSFGEDGEGRRGSSPAFAEQPAELTACDDNEEAVADDDAPVDPQPALVPPQALPDQAAPRPASPTTAPGGPLPHEDEPSPSEAETGLYPTTDYDSPNAPPIDHRSYSEVHAYEGENTEQTNPPAELTDNKNEEDMQIEASHGRLLSMNLIAAVVECGVLQAEEDVATRLFVPEVMRMRFDESYAVRREAALAMGELLKVVSDEVAMDQLLTLFDALAVDENPHVRQAACLALPALTRHLSPFSFKREHTLKVLPGFFQDETKEIQNTALEILGELVHSFHGDEEGLPDELIDYFLGPPRPKKEPRVDDGTTLNFFSTAQGLSILSGLDDEADYRQIVCAFNFPAVALTAGREGWPRLREFYLELTEDSQVQVRRSLASSLHEMAKILGNEVSSADLVPFFHRCLEAEHEIRERLWDNLHVFLGALDQTTAWPIIHKIGKLLVEGQLANWRLRERLMESLPSMAESMINGQNGKYLIVSLLREGLIDRVAAVRDAAIASIPSLYATTRKIDNLETLNDIDEVLRALAVSPQYRQRRTFVRCMDTFMDAECDLDLVLERSMPELVKVNNDPVVDVRFALANFLVHMCGPDGRYPALEGAPQGLVAIANSLRNDESFDVRERVADVFPEDGAVTRRPSAAQSVASAPHSPPPATRRTSSTSSASSIPLNFPMRSPGTPNLEDVTEMPESILQLENVPSPLQSPKVVPGYELHGYAFEESTSKEEALKELGGAQGLGLDQSSLKDGSVTPTPTARDGQQPTEYFSPPRAAVSSS